MNNKYINLNLLGALILISKFILIHLGYFNHFLSITIITLGVILLVFDFPLKRNKITKTPFILGFLFGVLTNRIPTEELYGLLSIMFNDPVSVIIICLMVGLIFASKNNLIK